MGTYRAEEEHGLPVVDETPCGGKAEFAEIARERFLTPSHRGNESGEEVWNERAFLADAQVQPGVLAIPDHLTIAQPRRPPIVLDEAPGLVAAEPSGEIVELVAVGQDGRETNDPTLGGVWASQEPLDLNLIADFTLTESDHVAFVEDEQADVVEEARIVPQREIQFLRRRDHDVALADRIFVEPADPNAPIERGDRFSERAEGALQGCFGLCRQRPPRCYEDDPAPRRTPPSDPRPGGIPPVVGGARGGPFVSTNPDASRWCTSRSAVIRAIMSSA